MDRVRVLEPIQPESDDIFYPESDGEPMGETGIHVLATLHLMSALRYLLHGIMDHYIIADMFLYYERGNPRAVKAPDVMVIKGVDASYERRTFKVWEENAVPSVIFEVTSDSTATEDLTVKYALYESLGVSEYFIFDPLNEYVPGQMKGFRLFNKGYVEIQPNPDGTLTSDELRVLMQPEEHLLRLLDPNTYAPIPGLDEAIYEAERQRVRAEQEAQRAEQEAQRAEQEAQRADLAEAEARNLRQTIEELRKRIASDQGPAE